MPNQNNVTLTLLRTGMNLLSRVSPSAASRVAFDLFRTPRRFRTPEWERALMAGAEPFEVRLTTRTTIRAWRWGDGPLVILVHGWEGRGSQLASFAPPLVAAGYSVVTFDAPAHGQSSGRKSSLPHFAWALRGVAAVAGSPRAIIGHSLGCAAAALAASEGLEMTRALFIAPPLHPQHYTRQFGEMFGLRDEVIEGLQERIVERFVRNWSDYSLATIAPRMNAELLIVHDREDLETPWSGGARLAEIWPGARLVSTTGLGHRRVLRDARVIEEATEFVRTNTPAETAIMSV